jgi:multiple sugar transport system permease protein
MARGPVIEDRESGIGTAQRRAPVESQHRLMPRRHRVAVVVAYAALAVVGVTMLLPFLWMVSTSLKGAGYASETSPQWIPSEPLVAEIDGTPCAVAEVAGERGLRVAMLRGSPQGEIVEVIAPRERAGERRVLPESQLVPVRVVRFHWENYLNAWRGIKVQEAFGGRLQNVDGFVVFYLNSLLVSICVTLGTVLTSSLAAFAFARMRFPGRDQVFVGYLATLMVPSIVIMLPVYALLAQLRMTNTYAALIVPAMFSAYGTFLLRQFFLTIPQELEDAAVIDGASPFAIYRHIVLPLSKPALATLTTFVFLHSWNDFLWPLMVVDRLGLKTLPIGLAHFQDSYTTEYHLLMAASVIVMVPVLVVFVLGQRYFVRGIALSGIKG